MGSKPSKNSDDRWIHKRSSHLRSVLSPNNNNNSNNNNNNKKEKEQCKTPSSSVVCTTEQPLPEPTVTKKTIHYDPLKSKKARRKNSPSNKHFSIISNNSNDNMSSGWTTLSNDPFSQIEAANTSSFTDITDQSTISKKSLYPVIESSPVLNHLELLSPLKSNDILHQLDQSPNNSFQIIKDAYKSAQQQNDPFDWNQFYLAMEQYTTSTNSSIGIVYLARCLISGLGIKADIQRGFQLLKSNPSCETTYALGHCYLDKGEKKAGFQCFQTVINAEYSQMTESIHSTVAEAQCTLARMLFQGEGVEQNTTQALNLLMKSAQSNM